MTSPPVTVCPTRYAAGYMNMALEEFVDLIPEMDNQQRLLHLTKQGRVALREWHRRK